MLDFWIQMSEKVTFQTIMLCHLFGIWQGLHEISVPGHEYREKETGRKVEDVRS